jgi:hypothetical protein
MVQQLKRMREWGRKESEEQPLLSFLNYVEH